MPFKFMPLQKKSQDICTVALLKSGRYSFVVAANSATDLGGSNDFRRNSAIYSIAGAFFVPAIMRYGELRRSTFGCAGFLNHRSANLAQFATHSCLAASCGGSSDSGATSSDHYRSVQKTRRCTSCNGSRRFTRKLQPSNPTIPLQQTHEQSPRLGNNRGCSMTSTELVEFYIHRASRIFDVPTLESLRWHGLGAIHALHASGLLTYAQHADALNLFVDTCSTRHSELTRASDESKGGAQ